MQWIPSFRSVHLIIAIGLLISCHFARSPVRPVAARGHFSGYQSDPLLPRLWRESGEVTCHREEVTAKIADHEIEIEGRSRQRSLTPREEDGLFSK